MKSLNIAFTGKNSVEILVETIDAPQPHEIQCMALKSLISTGTETLCLRGIFDTDTNWNRWVKYPFIPGYSMVAVVTDVGDDVRNFKVGDHVVAEVGHRQYFNVKASDAFLIPDGVNDEDATWAMLACTTQLAVRRAALTLGETVGIVGLGMLGQLVTQYVRNTGARYIVAIDPASNRLELAESHGATHALALDARDAYGAVKEITKGKMLDVVFDITGHPSVLAQTTPLVRKLGRLVLLGDTPTPSQQSLGPNVVYDSITILGSHITQVATQETIYNPWTLPQVMSLFFDYLIQGRMNVADLNSHCFSPTEACSVYDWLLRDRASSMGVLFDWEKL